MCSRPFQSPWKTVGPLCGHLAFFFKPGCLVRSNGARSNSISTDFADHAIDEIDPSTELSPAETDELFKELERWHDVLKPHENELQGPRP